MHPWGPSPRGVLLDLDGTLADTAPELGSALNALRRARGLPALPLRLLRPYVSAGARGLLEGGMDLGPAHPDYPAARAELLARYAQVLGDTARLFDGMAALLAALRTRGIRWGVVTNKPLQYAGPLLAALGVEPDGGCLVTPDGLAAAKPDPEGTLRACELLGLPPARVVFVGDDARDVQAGRAAGTRTVGALWGYLAPGSVPVRWGADALLAAPAGLLRLLTRWGSA